MRLDDPFTRHRAFISSSASAAPPPSSPSAALPQRLITMFSASSSVIGSHSNAFMKRLISPPHFSHMARLALAPAAVCLLDLGGRLVLTILFVGLLLSYLLDSLRLNLAAFFAVCAALVASQFALFFSASIYYSPLLSLLALLLWGETTFVIGVWACLQCRWVQIESPSIS